MLSAVLVTLVLFGVLRESQVHKTAAVRVISMLNVSKVTLKGEQLLREWGHPVGH
jgi:hypothetical protein